MSRVENGSVNPACVLGISLWLDDLDRHPGLTLFGIMSAVDLSTATVVFTVVLPQPICRSVLEYDDGGFFMGHIPHSTFFGSCLSPLTLLPGPIPLP